MKKLKRSGYKSRLLIPLLASILFAGTAEAQYYEKSRHVSKAYAVESETEIQVSNKYGTVHLMPWDKDSVRFEVDLVVKAKKESKVDKIFNYIEFSFTATSYYVIAKTEINKSTFWTEVSDAANALFSADNKAQIDFTVYYPRNSSLEVVNKFGNVYTTDHDGKLDIEISNGDLKAHDLTGETNINLEFGNASIHRINKGNLKINYSEFNLEETNVITVNSKSSTLNIGKVEELNLNSRRDKFNIKDLGTLNGESSFSIFKIQNASESIVIKTEYGEFFLDEVRPAFHLLNINAEFTDIQLSFPDNFTYNLEIEHDKRTVISYPSSYTDIQQEVKDKKEEIYRTYGKVGTAGSQNTKVEINNSAGSIKINPE